MLSVAHLIADLGNGGAERSLYNLLSLQRGRGFRPIVVSMTNILAPYADRIRGLGVSVHSLNARRHFPDPRAVRRFVGILECEKVDLIHSWMFHANLLAVMVRPWFSAPLIWNIRQPIQPLKNYKLRTALVVACCNAMRRFPEMIVTNSPETYRRLSHAMSNPEKCCFIANGVDTALFRPDKEARSTIRKELGIESGAILVGMIARYHPSKDHAGFLAAARLVAARSPEVELALAGKSIEHSNRELSVMIGDLSAKVHLLGERDDVHRILPAMDIVALSSQSEGFPNILLEALSCGVPCVSTDAGAAREIVADAGRVTPPGRPEELADAIEELVLLGAEERSMMGRRGRARVEQEFPLRRMAESYATLFASVADRRA